MDFFQALVHESTMLTPRITEGWGKQRPTSAWLQSAFSFNPTVGGAPCRKSGYVGRWAQPNDRFCRSAWKSPVPFAASHAQTPLGRLNLIYKVSPTTPNQEMTRLLQPARSTIASDRLITNSRSGPDPDSYWRHLSLFASRTLQ
jgi:hypothetical protein